MKKYNPVVCRDFNSRTCIEISRDDKMVSYIPMDVETGFAVVQSTEAEFDRNFKAINGYPVKRACELYFKWSASLGATKEVLDFFKTQIKISDEEIKMATKKANDKATEGKTKVAPKAKAPAKASTGKVAAKPATKAKAPAAKAPAAKGKAPAAKKDGEKKRTASAAFCELIMEGKLSDDGIFAAVQKEFGLSDDKRSYVKWYRNKLTKDGKNPPGPK
jgi:hypothetical protein